MKTAFDIDDYWKSRCEQEKKRADDNLRLAAERATEIAALRQRNRELAIDLEQTTEDWKREMARAVAAEREREKFAALLLELREEFDGLALLASAKPVEAHESAFRKLVAEIDDALGVSAETP